MGGRWRVWEEGGGCDGVSSSGCRVSVRRGCWVKVKSMVVVVIVWSSLRGNYS